MQRAEKQAEIDSLRRSLSVDHDLIDRIREEMDLATNGLLENLAQRFGIGSTGSLLSVGSAGSMLSVNSDGAMLCRNGERMSGAEIATHVGTIAAVGLVAGALTTLAARLVR